MAQVVAGRVFDEPTIQVEEFAGAGHDLEAEHPFARQSVAQHPDATSVGGDVATDLAGAPAREVDRIEKSMVPRGFLDLLGCDAGLDGQRLVGSAKFGDGPHAVHRHHQFAPRRHRATRQPGTSTRGHQRHPVGPSPAHDRLDLLHRLGLNDGQWCRRRHSRPILAVGDRIDVDRGRMQRRQRVAEVIAHRQGPCMRRRLRLWRSGRPGQPGEIPFDPVASQPPFAVARSRPRRVACGRW
jgi:hypothetical protein